MHIHTYLHTDSQHEPINHDVFEWQPCHPRQVDAFIDLMCYTHGCHASLLAVIVARFLVLCKFYVSDRYLVRIGSCITNLILLSFSQSSI